MMLFFKNLIFTLVVPGSVAGLFPWLIVREQPIVLNEGVGLALIFFITGGILYSYCVWGFAYVGGGTPAPIDAPKKLVVHGAYRYTRNPMYLGVLAILVGWAVLFQTISLLTYAVCVGIVIHLLVIGYEEPQLRKAFGAEYKLYCSQVRRWLPFFSR
ncbi:isoprenylcysteine carboxylmethyltransferase family protein [Methylomarinum sp. Ch1-1]|uniref:Isoprenylcysteine carboxylmethyltransferase family protein n=1 Tax=Methylomarinum roseum TaxID=3067653 RepID=A0AAU7NTY4_9GAMM